jgi:hypothetical protein
MKCDARVINRGRSVFMALLMLSYSFVATSKSCSNYGVNKRYEDNEQK